MTAGGQRTGESRPSAGALALLTGLLLLAGCHKHARARAAAGAPPLPAGARHGRVTDDADGRVVGVPERPSAAAPAPAVEPPSLALRGAPFSTQTGLASWYGPPYAGRKGADGTVYDQNAMTAAHLSYALGTVVRVTNLTNGQSAVVRITDRGPFVRGRIIDLSLRAAKEIGVYRAGVVRVRVEAYNEPALKPNTPVGGRWCVQVGAFPSEADARQEKLELTGRFPGARVLAFAGPTGWWVRLNPPLADRSHATAVMDSIHLPDEAQPYLVRTD